MASKEFFASLYNTQPAQFSGDFDAVVTRLVAKQGDKIVAGDQALQALLLAHAVSTPENAAKAKPITAALSGIKMLSIDSFVKAYPGVSLDRLISEAKAAGHQVEVLGA